ncbi:MAG: hypothetical protein KAJ53_13705 [Anaerolineales bacterium]|nr:hypothetical protein [Anaerolineales bacterium]
MDEYDNNFEEHEPMSQDPDNKSQNETSHMGTGIAIGTGAGVALGVVFGIALGNMAFMGIGIAIGVSIGVAIGAALNEKSRSGDN